MRVTFDVLLQTDKMTGLEEEPSAVSVKNAEVGTQHPPMSISHIRDDSDKVFSSLRVHFWPNELITRSGMCDIKCVSLSVCLSVFQSCIF